MTDPARTSAIVLAAGSASRFGAVKLLARLDGVPLLERVIGTARAARVGEVVVVLGDAAPDLEAAIDLTGVRIVRNPHPADGLSSSLRLGLAAVGPSSDGALVLLGDQPLVRGDVIAALLAAPVPDGRSIIVPRYRDDGAINPALLLRDSWPLADRLTGDRGMGPVIRAHPELVVEVPVDGANPDVDTPADLALVDWARRVRANREQVDRVREVGDGDFYASGTSLFVADPHRSDADDATLAALRSMARPGQRWLDVGAGAGRYALPLALAVTPGEVTAVEVSASMLTALREGMQTHGIENVRVVEGRWPAVAPEAVGAADGDSPSAQADVALIAHVGYDIESIGPFLEALERAATTCVAVMMDRTPASIAEPYWPPVHGEPRVPLPAMPEFVALLRARGRSPEVRLVERTERAYVDRDQALGLLRRQTWVRPDGEKDRRLRSLLDERTIERPDGRIALRDAPELQIGIVTWAGSAD